ncbi:formate transporter FocA [Histidinibacterium aquaticum]|uniref:Formate transporter FocA n=2 Tax=Histidinibacterium aquaticum TaxID=2613962 RepID=A0A5J5GC90_9RHOB|nr:formate transporter FocA [Histidinibacterium aquaticum]
MAQLAERTGVKKAEQDWHRLLALSALAGAFVAFGATFAAAVTAGADGAPEGLVLLAGGLAFTLAYVLAIVGGAELFTTNNLMVMAWAHGRLPLRRLFRAWGIVFVGNFIGAAGMAALLILSERHEEVSGGLGGKLLSTAHQINDLGALEALLLGILGNSLLCLGVWLTYSARSTVDRILALTPPVAAFYVLGLEHAIAVMFYLPCATMISLFADAQFWAVTDYQPLWVSPFDFLRVLVPVTIGNVLGGGALVALIYWFVYLQPARN